MRKLEELCDIESESGVIATLINRPDFLLYSDQLKQETFFDITNGCLFVAISDLYNVGIQNIDTYNLMNAINGNKQIKQQLGADFTKETVSEIITFSVHISRNTAEEYNKLTKSILEYAFKRRLYRDLEKCKVDCFNDQLSISDLHSSVQNKIDEVTVNFMTSEVKAYKDIVESLWEQTKSKFSLGNDEGYTSKFLTAKEYFIYEPGELVLVAGKRKRGKSMLALNEAVDKLDKGIGVLYIDTELQDGLFNDRLLTHYSQVEFKKLRRGEFDKDQEKAIEKAIAHIKTLNFFHVHMPKWDKDKLYLLSKKIMRNHGVTFLIYDHLKTTESKDTSGAYHELGSKVNFLKDVLCGELGYAGLCLAQLNRGGDIGDSFRLEQEVSTVLNIDKKTEEEILRDTTDCGNYKMFVKANRNGTEMDDIEQEYIDLMFRGNICSFIEAKQHNTPKSPFDE
jgi:replicative DNA helicase